ncbi:hypothetical protein [Thermovibrio sp.]
MIVETSQWQELVILSLNDNPLPDHEGFLKLLLPENYFFSLVRFNQEKTFWKGIFKSKEAFRKFSGKETVAIKKGEGSPIQVIALTRCLTFVNTPSLKFTLNELSVNPCIKTALNTGEGIVVKFTTSYSESLFIKEFWSFTAKTEGFCPPAACGSVDCHRLGGVSAPVIINKNQIC